MRQLAILCGLLFVSTLHGDAELSPRVDSTAAERGYHNLTTKNYSPAVWSLNAYANAWKRWPGVKDKPADYDAAFREHYGLHAAPFANNNLPMGMREGRRLLGKGVALNCMLCHGGSINGQSYVGLPNSTIDIQAFFEDLNGADGLPPMTPFSFGTVRGTTEAGAFAVFLLGLRNPDLSLRAAPIDLGLHDDLCEDPPAWWLLKKKKTMYWTGGADQRSVRSIMQFMMSPLNGPMQFHSSEADFGDIREYFLTIEAPKYPYSVNREVAACGETLFRSNCARCHGTYGPDGGYPNKIIPLEEIGTDRTRYDGIEARFGEYYDQSWFAKEKTGWFSGGYVAKPSLGYQAPPLDGIWATAPYFHNGSVPTIYHVINSTARPTRFLRTFRTGADDYDAERMGWKVADAGPPNPRQPAFDRRKIYDTRMPGRGNGGHTFGDHLTDAERMAIVEYLKTL